MAPKTEGFSLTASGSSPSLFIAMPVTTTFAAATAMGGSTQTTAVDSAVPLFAALTVQGNHTDGANSAARPLFIIGQQQKSKAKCLKKKIRSVRGPQKCETPKATDSATAAQEPESCQPTDDKPCPPVTEEQTDDNRNDCLSFPSKPKILAQVSKNSAGDGNASVTCASVTVKQPVENQAGLQPTFAHQPVSQPTFACQPGSQPIFAHQPGAQPPFASQPGSQPPFAHQPDSQPSFAQQPGSQPSFAHQPDSQPTFASQPGSQPLFAHQPDSQPSFAHQPDSQPSFAHQPVSQPTFACQPGSQPIFAHQPGAQPPFASQPGSQPPFAHQPDSQPSFAQQPGSQPSFAHQPGLQPPFASQPGSQPPLAHQPVADASKSAGASPSHCARSVTKNHAHIFSFNPNRHKLNAGSSLGKAHSIDFLSRPASSPISRSNSNSSTSAFSFKPNAAGAFANASTINVSSFSFKPQAIVSIGNESKDTSRAVSRPSQSDDPKSAFSTFSFRPNAAGTFGIPPTVNAAGKPDPCANILKDSISPFSFQPSASSSFGNAPTFNFVYNPTAAKNSEHPNKIPMFAMNARESALHGGCLFGNATIFGKNEIAQAGFTFRPSTVSKTDGAFFPAVDQTRAKFSCGSGEYKSPGQFPCLGNPGQQPLPKMLRQSSTGFLFSPSRLQASNCLGVGASNTLFNIGAAKPAVAQPNKPEDSNAPHVQADERKEPLRAGDTNAAPTQTLQRFSFGADKAPAVSLLPASGANPFVVQIQNISAPGGNSSACPQALSISHTNTPKPCISINTNNNLIIQITNDSVQVIINSSNNS